MKKKIFVTGVIVLLTFICKSIAGVGITDVNIIPVYPLENDLVTIKVFGEASMGGSHVEYEEFSQNGTSLLLDLHVDMGATFVISNWSYSKEIGALEPGNYLLTVRAFKPDWCPPFPNEPYIYTKEFIVTPEPTTLILFSFAIPILRKFTAHHKALPNKKT